MTAPLPASAPFDANPSPLLAWAKRAELMAEKPAEAKSPKDSMKDMTAVFMHMLQGLTSNPMQETNPAEGIRVVQGLAEAYARSSQDETLQEIKTAMTQNNLLQAATLVGRRGEFLSSHFTKGDTQSDGVGYEVAEGTAHVKVTIFGPRGEQVASFAGEATPGFHALDGLLKDLPAGDYGLDVQGVDGSGKTTLVTPLVAARVDAIRIQEGEVLVRMGRTFTPIAQMRGVDLAGVDLGA